MLQAAKKPTAMAEERIKRNRVKAFMAGKRAK